MVFKRPVVRPVEDCDALAQIFNQLGYNPVFRYEKFRTEWELADGHLVLDETPIGVWAELEGVPEWIESMLSQLGIASELCSTESYGKLFLDALPTCRVVGKSETATG